MNEYFRFNFGVLIIMLISCVLIFIYIGCANITAIEEEVAKEITHIDEGTGSVIGVIHTASKIVHYASEMHKAGVDKDVIKTVQDALEVVHRLAEEEHAKIKEE